MVPGYPRRGKILHATRSSCRTAVATFAHPWYRRVLSRALPGPRRPDGTTMERDAKDRAYWNRHARNYDRSMMLFGRPVARMIELAAQAVRGSSRVLEVAAGTGLLTPALAREAREVIATDYAVAMVSAVAARVRAAGLANVRCEQADLYDLPYDAGSFDAVVAANVLHLVPDLEGALAAFRKMLKPGGRLVVPTYCHDASALAWVFSRILALTGFPGHRRFTPGRLRETLESAGLAITQAETLPGLFPIAYLEGTFAA